WFAGLFYLPRLFVYHAMNTDITIQEQFKVMESKLYYGIMMPSIILAVGLGVWLWIEYWWEVFIIFKGAGWLHLKIGLVALLIIYHFYCGKYLKDFKNNRNRHSHVFYRWFNELPAVLLVIITILVVVKPF
ncbi:MAG: CopD family protein, partial [Thiomargarita sp.]|nr:CopD family protein [Thiomargarita sp.]